MVYLSTELIGDITTALTGFGTTLLTYFVELLPAIAGIVAIYFVINIIRSKVG